MSEKAMRGAVKAGLVCGCIGLGLLLLGLALPFGGILLCGPVLAMVLGGCAGFLGVSWSNDAAGIGQGVLAGALAGTGLLMGMVLRLTLEIVPQLTDPRGYASFQTNLAPTLISLGIPPSALVASVVGASIGIGACLGVIMVVVALPCSVLGAWHALRQRQHPDRDGQSAHRPR